MTDSNMPVIEMKDISKRFGDFYANKNINLQLKKGEIHALLGENGAGKSTLMNILSGLLEPTSGDIYMSGEKVEIDSPSRANRLGIGMVHQHFMLIDAFTVLENIMLGEETVSGLTLDKASAQAKIEELSRAYGLNVDIKAKVSSISVGMQQRVEILKVLYRGADILIFDEPTASLTPQEITDLIETLRKLANEGKSIIIITHKLDEIKQVADRCTVIRRGESIDTVDVKTTTPKQLADMMVGRSVSFTTEKVEATPTDNILEIKDLVVKDERDIVVVENISLNVRKGEIVGIAGIDGNGQSELILAMTGLMPIESGTVIYDGVDITGQTPRQINEAGISHIPEDRHKYGLVLDMSIESNIALKNYYKKPFSNRGLLNFGNLEKQAKRLIEEYDVRTTSEKATARSLSGGNQQKAIIAREIDSDPKFLIAANPTRGLDVGAIEFIHKSIIEQRDNGKGVLLMSFELDEILDVTDRVLVMFDGRIVADIPTSETNEQDLGLMMAGTPYSEIVKERQKGSAVQ
ncbi:ABC transporter ATP-binding protein [Aerococcaceae bacterium WGS1372]